MNRQLDEIWEQIEAWNARNSESDLGSSLNPGATNEAIEKLTKQLEVQLPLDFLDSLKRHNGTVAWTTEFCNGTLLSADLMQNKLHEMRCIADDLLVANRNNGIGEKMTLTVSGPVQSQFWSDRWIPFHVSDYSQTCFDFSPAPRGEIGQIISVSWEGGTVKVIAPNFLEFLRLCAKELPNETEP